MQSTAEAVISAATPYRPDVAVRKALTMQVVNDAGPRRTLLEGFIRNGFASCYGARLRELMPVLIAVGRHEPGAALGIRRGTEQLFVETYLNQPLDEVLRAHNVACERSHIAELGNLYSSASRYTLPLLLTVSLALVKSGVNLLVFTATSALRQLLQGNGLQLRVLAQASIDKLPVAERQYWGSYYQSAPQVVALDLTEVTALVASHAQLSRFLALPGVSVDDMAQQLSEVF